MILESVNLTNFRSYYGKHEFKFSPQTTLVVGNNGVGKTNLLEAAYLLAAAKSPRARYDKQLIHWSEEHTWVQGVFTNRKRAAPSHQTETLELGIIARTPDTNLATKRYRVNSVSKTARDFISRFRAVLFTPEDIKLVLGSPSRRRDYLNAALTQTSDQYYTALKNYHRVIRQKNKLLKQVREGEQSADQLEFWNSKIVELGTIINQHRQTYLDYCNQQLPGLSPRIFRSGSLQLPYRPNLPTKERLTQYQSREIGAGTSLVGPHRDDFSFELWSPVPQSEDNTTPRSLDVYGSRGQQRLATLALKICEYKFLRQDYDQNPLLLLDDIFSELDPEHQQLVLGLLDKGQSIVTTTNENLIPERLRGKWKIIQLPTQTSPSHR